MECLYRSIIRLELGEWITKHVSAVYPKECASGPPQVFKEHHDIDRLALVRLVVIDLCVETLGVNDDG